MPTIRARTHRHLRVASLVACGLALAAPPAAAVDSPTDPHGCGDAPWLTEHWTGPVPPHGKDDPALDPTRLKHVKVVYAHAKGAANRFAAYANVIQCRTRKAASVLAAIGPNPKSLRMDLLPATSPARQLDIAVVELSRTKAELEEAANKPYPAQYPPDYGAQLVYGWVTADVREKVADSRPRDFVVWVDNVRVNGADGMAEVPGFGFLDKPGAVAVAWGDGSASFNRLEGGSAPEDNDPLASRIVLHETLHMLGAVQNGSPNDDGPGSNHCKQGYDTVCSPYAGQIDCQDPNPHYTLIVDCRGDDYYNPAPLPGTWLATGGWNVYNSGFLCPVARCRNDAPAAALTAPAQATAGTPVTLDARGSADDDPPGLRFAWDADGDGTFEVAAAPSPTHTVTYASAGTRRPAVRVVDSDGLEATAGTQIDVAAPPSTPPTPPKPAAPVLSRLSVRAQRGRVTISFRLSAAANVRFALTRLSRKRPIGTFARRGRAGVNRIRWNGRLGKRRVRPGRYRLTATPVGGRGAGVRVRLR